MPKRPHQPEITIQVVNEGTPFQSAVAVQVPGPPEGCESQQLMDWAAVAAIMAMPNYVMEVKMRLITVYAERWQVPMNTSDTLPPLQGS